MLSSNECWPVCTFRNVKLTEDADGLPFISNEETLRSRLNPVYFSDSDNITIIVRDEKYIQHYFHFIETLLCIYAASTLFAKNSKVTQIWLPERWDNPNQASFQKHLIDLLFPDATILHKIDMGVEAGPTIYFNRDLSRTEINKLIDPMLDVIRLSSRLLRSKVYKYLNIEERQKPVGKNTLLYARRTGERIFTPEVESKLLTRFSNHFDIIDMDFWGMGWVDQIKAGASVDAFFGIHGNNLTNSIWMPSHGSVIEIFPEAAHHYDYQLMAEAMGLRYVGIEGATVFREFSRFGKIYGEGQATHSKVTHLHETAINTAFSAVVYNPF